MSKEPRRWPTPSEPQIVRKLSCSTVLVFTAVTGAALAVPAATVYSMVVR